MATLSYQMMQKFYEVQEKFKNKNKWEISFLIDSLVDLSDAISKSIVNENLTLEEQLARYRKAFNQRLSSEKINPDITPEEIENISGIINEVTCSSQYNKNINS